MTTNIDEDKNWVKRRKHGPSLGQLLDASRGFVSIAGPCYLSSPSPCPRPAADVGFRRHRHQVLQLLRHTMRAWEAVRGGGGTPAAEAPQDDLPSRSPPSPHGPSPPPPPSPASSPPVPATSKEPTGSAASPTTSTVASSPASSPRTARAPLRSPHAGGLWRTAPLILVDAHFLPFGADCPARAVRDAISAALAAHPGPFLFVADRTVLAPWFTLLATKGVEDLVFVNRPWPVSGLHLPAPLFICASLRRLYLIAWVFPDTAKLPRGASFPSLQKLVLGAVVMEDRDLEFVLATSPVLQVIAVAGNLQRLRARLATQNLKCVQFYRVSVVEEVALVDAPCLQRFFIWRCWGQRHGGRTKIRHAPELSMMEYLEAGVHELENGNTIILVLPFRFSLIEETHETSAKLNHKFWQETGPIECVQSHSHLKTLVLREFQGEQRELKFLMYIAENALELEKMVLVLKFGRFSAPGEVAAKFMDLDSTGWASGAALCRPAAPSHGTDKEIDEVPVELWRAEAVEPGASCCPRRPGRRITSARTRRHCCRPAGDGATPGSGHRSPQAKNE
ncbi:putative F-box/FBD/LRR-repeat protein [Panicum miliaceum]|uniref:F-box/FBD/LRR-repeat protein n=1 Tax=Panicum miliaceum TaxID=4540 RepID=A0A3L6S7X5_PANMI|nr:putative F-box/FBD/LRR-repeat protein [Panicum miliaceum]